MAISEWKPPIIGCRPVAVLGAGVLGRRIGCIFAAAGYRVHIRDPSVLALEDAIAYITAHSIEYAQYLKPGRHSLVGEACSFTGLEQAVQDAWLVVEAIPEKLHLKIETFGELDRLTPPDCVFGTNSSSYKSSLMLDKVSTQRRRQILNVHFSMPPKIRTVELMTDGFTAPAVLDFVKHTLESCAMLPVIARKESTGFIINRLWAAVKRETLQILAEGVSEPEEIDLLWQNMFLNCAPPCRLMDEIGLDTVALIEDHYVEERQLDGQMTVDWLRENYVSKGLLGNKSGLGGLYAPKTDERNEGAGEV